jgi:hypothetical protein
MPDLNFTVRRILGTRQKVTKDLAIIAVITPALFFLIGYTKGTVALATAAVQYVGPTVVRVALIVFLMWVCRSIIRDAILSALEKRDADRAKGF